MLGPHKSHVRERYDITQYASAGGLRTVSWDRADRRNTASEISKTNGTFGLEVMRYSVTTRDSIGRMITGDLVGADYYMFGNTKMIPSGLFRIVSAGPDDHYDTDETTQRVRRLAYVNLDRVAPPTVDVMSEFFQSAVSIVRPPDYHIE